MHRMKKWLLFAGTGAALFGWWGCGGTTLGQAAIELVDIAAGYVAGTILNNLGI